MTTTKTTDICNICGGTIYSPFHELEQQLEENHGTRE